MRDAPVATAIGALTKDRRRMLANRFAAGRWHARRLGERPADGQADQ
jgi:hypothetical protein